MWRRGLQRGIRRLVLRTLRTGSSPIHAVRVPVDFAERFAGDPPLRILIHHKFRSRVCRSHRSPFRSQTTIDGVPHPFVFPKGARESAADPRLCLAVHPGFGFTPHILSGHARVSAGKARARGTVSSRTLPRPKGCGTHLGSGEPNRYVLCGIVRPRCDVDPANRSGRNESLSVWIGSEWN